MSHYESPEENTVRTTEQRLVEARTRAAEIIATGIEVVDLAELIAGAPLIPAAPKRDETPLPPGLVETRAKEKAIRASLTEIGVGLSEDRNLEDAGLPADTPVALEAGQRHKMEAEKRLVGKGPVVVSGSKFEQVTGEQRTVTARLFYGGNEESVGATEYDEAQQTAITLEGFAPLETPIEIGRIKSDGRIGDDEEFGTLWQIGTHQDGAEGVYTFDVPRKYLFDEQGNPVVDERGRQKYEQPNAGQQLVAFAQLLDWERGAVATSSTYFPSRLAAVVHAAFAGLKEGIVVPKMDVLAYCPATLGKVRHESKPNIPGLAHILGEAYVTRQQLQKLRQELTQGDNGDQSY